MKRTDVQSATHVQLNNGQIKKIKTKWGIDKNGHLAKEGFGVITDDGESIDMMTAKLYWKES